MGWCGVRPEPGRHSSAENGVREDRKEVSAKLAKNAGVVPLGHSGDSWRFTVKAFLEAWMRDVQEPRLSRRPIRRMKATSGTTSCPRSVPSPWGS